MKSMIITSNKNYYYNNYDNYDNYDNDLLNTIYKEVINLNVLKYKKCEKFITFLNMINTKN